MLHLKSVKSRRSGFVIFVLLSLFMLLSGLFVFKVWQLHNQWSPLLRPKILEQAESNSVRILGRDESANIKWLGSITHGRLKEKAFYKLSDIPNLQIQAIVRLEDPRFLDHGGFDWRGILRAALINLKHLQFSQGGSTITQQLVKNIFLSKERTLSRKFTELFLAIFLEKEFAKDEILESYLNEVYLGQLGAIQIHGLGRAAEYYFSKKLGELRLEEMALLAALIAGPGYYSPFKHPDRAMTRRNKVLDKLYEAKLIVESEYKEALSTPLPKSSALLSTLRASYLIDAISEKLREERSEGELIQGGFDLYTNLDLPLQDLAEKTLIQKTSEWGADYQGLVVAARPKDCSVLIYAGGTDYKKTQLDRIRQSKRPIGSLMKPLEVFPLLENDETVQLATQLLDQPLSWNYKGAPEVWKPQNYDRKFRSVVTLRQSLEESLNVPIVRLFFDREPSGSLQDLLDPVRALGLEINKERALPSALLGAVEQTPMNTLLAFTRLTRKALGLSADENDFHCRLQLTEPEKTEATEESFSPVHQAGARLTIAALEGALRRGTSSSIGKKIAISTPWAAKTGTSSDKRDSWYVALSPEIVILAWVGRDDNQITPFTGASGAAQIVEPLIQKQNAKFSAWSWPEVNDLEWKWVDSKRSCISNTPQGQESFTSQSSTTPPPQIVETPSGLFYQELFKTDVTPKSCE